MQNLYPKGQNSGIRRLLAAGIGILKNLSVYYIGRVGIEPTRYLYRRILSPLRLPIPPPPLSENILHGLGIWSSVRNRYTYFHLELLSFATRHIVM